MNTLAALLADKQNYDNAGGAGGGAAVIFVLVVLWLLIGNGPKK